jgi:hypothetical protein
MCQRFGNFDLIRKACIMIFLFLPCLWGDLSPAAQREPVKMRTPQPLALVWLRQLALYQRQPLILQLCSPNRQAIVDRRLALIQFRPETPLFHDRGSTDSEGVVFGKMASGPCITTQF